MLDNILKVAITRRGLVLLFVLLLAGLGAWNFTRLTIDAVPDITNVQVVVNTPADSQVQVWIDDHERQWHSLVVSRDAISGVPFIKDPDCEECREAVPAT